MVSEWVLFNKKKSVPAHRNCIFRTASFEKGIFPVLDVMILGNSAYLHCRCDLCAFFNIDAFHIILSSWHVKLTVSRSGESSVFTSVSTFSVYSCETSQREDRRVGLMTIASSVAEWVASGTLDPGASLRISLRVSAGSLSFRQRSLIFLSFSLFLKLWLRALPRALSAQAWISWAWSLRVVIFFVGKLTKVCSFMMGCSKFTRAFGPRKRSPPPPP